MDQQLISYPIMHHYLKAYKQITSLKLRYNQFRPVLAEESVDGLIMPKYASRGRPAADTPIRLQAAHWAHFRLYIAPNPVKTTPSRQCRVCSNKKIKS